MLEDGDHRKGEHHRRNEGKSEHEAVDGAGAALASEVGHGRLDGVALFGDAAYESAEAAVDGREVEDAPPLRGGAEAGEEDDGKCEREIRADADLFIDGLFGRFFGGHDTSPLVVLE